MGTTPYLLRALGTGTCSQGLEIRMGTWAVYAATCHFGRDQGVGEKREGKMRGFEDQKEEKNKRGERRKEGRRGKRKGWLGYR